MRKAVPNIIVRIILYTYSIVVIFPMVWTIYTSFKTNREFFSNPFALPAQLNFDNYASAWEKANIGMNMLNTAFVTTVSLALILAISFLAAYAIARFVIKPTSFLNNLFMSGLFIPSSLVLIPVFLLIFQLNILDTHFSLITVYVAYSLPFSIYIMTGFLRSIAHEYEEAAYLDGCSYFGAMFWVIAPMARPALATVAIMNFTSLWNEYVFALVLIQSETKMTLSVGLARLSQIQRYATDWGALFAGLVLVMIPTLIFYVLLQKHIIAGLNVGGIKG